MPKYQVWVNFDLVGHITGEDVTPEDATEYAKNWRGDIESDDVALCEIPEGYYQDIIRSSAKDSIALGM